MEKKRKRNILRLWEVMKRVKLSKSQIYALKARGEFPQSVKIGPKAVGWYEDEIDEYLNTRPRCGDGRRKT